MDFCSFLGFCRDDRRKRNTERNRNKYRGMPRGYIIKMLLCIIKINTHTHTHTNTHTHTHTANIFENNILIGCSSIKVGRLLTYSKSFVRREGSVSGWTSLYRPVWSYNTHTHTHTHTHTQANIKSFELSNGEVHAGFINISVDAIYNSCISLFFSKALNTLRELLSITSNDAHTHTHTKTSKNRTNGRK
eukprot:GHVR01168022.1.p2 GENE.GHVR01168022.1~~GHVR01168022.1.p2  ORF type:complete len:190 (+),score=97.36 GHVR01168022.1:78-647(+)